MGLTVRRHVVSDSAGRQQQMDKRERDRDITNKKRKKEKHITEYVPCTARGTWFL